MSDFNIFHTHCRSDGLNSILDKFCQNFIDKTQFLNYAQILWLIKSIGINHYNDVGKLISLSMAPKIGQYMHIELDKNKMHIN